MNSVFGPLDGAASGGLPARRPLARVLAFEDGDPRFAKMDETWRTFGAEMAGQVSEALDGSTSSAERAYGVGVIVHNYFRARGITLTSYELRALASELVEMDVTPPAPSPTVEPAPPPSAPIIEEPLIEEPPPSAAAPELVSFTVKEEEATQKAWAGEEQTPAAPTVADTAFAAPPSSLVSVVGREAASFDRVLVKVVELAGPSVGPTPLDRALARATIERAMDQVLRDEDAAFPAEMRKRLLPMAFSEICGLGLLDRLWADRSIRAIYVDAPDRVHVDRGGVRMPAPETFRNAAHLLDIARRLARPASTGVVDVQLRDGSTGLVIFPPAAPAGPVLMLHRGEPGNATFERLVASRLLDRRIAALLGVAARARLNMLVTGPKGSGKTSLLAAIARDLSASRVVTLAAHRQFQWPSSAKVELFAQANGPSYGTLMTAAARLQPDTLVIDAPPPGDIPALAGRISRGARGMVVALGAEAPAAILLRGADIVVRLGPSPDGLVRVQAVEDATGAPVFVHDGTVFQRQTARPAFAGLVKEAGYGEALAGIFR